MSDTEQELSQNSNSSPQVGTIIILSYYCFITIIIVL